MSIESKLVKMKGKTFLHRTVIKRVIDFQLINDVVIISTDVNIVSIKLDKAEKALEEFLPAEPEAPKGLVKFSEDKRWSDLKDAAYAMVDKLKAEGGEKHIPTASAINSTIGSIVGMMKVEIEAVKLTQK